MDILESLFKTTEQPVALPHLGEVYGAWFFYMLCASALSFCQLTHNHVRDPELKKLIESLAHDLENPQMARLAKFLTNEGVAFPMGFPRHPKADPDAIPPGARMEDIEIANLQAMKLQTLITTCSANMQQALRDDIGVMYISFHQELLRASLKAKKLMQERGWLIVPPQYGPASVSH